MLVNHDGTPPHAFIQVLALGVGVGFPLPPISRVLVEDEGLPGEGGIPEHGESRHITPGLVSCELTKQGGSGAGGSTQQLLLCTERNHYRR